jgi:predicted metalloprotease
VRWQLGRRSSNVEDQRGMSVGGRGFQLGGCGLVLVILFALITKQNPLTLLGQIMQQQPSTQVQQPTDTSNPQASQQNDEQKDFVSSILGETEDIWGQVFTSINRTYEPPKLVLFTDGVQSACGMSSAAVGPFYCPMDSKVYIDLGFFNELSQRFGAPGDFARAYVIAHEVGHHVQNLLGTSTQVHDLQQRSSEEQANALSVRLELQADCYAGVWGYYEDQKRKLLEPGDMEEGLGAAKAVGDDMIQRQSGRAVSPESWTHGSSEMRQKWFTKGFQTGRIDNCNTFESRNL